MFLKDWALKHRRQFVIDVVKAPLMKAIILAASLIPEPTKENTRFHNSHVLIDAFDKLLEYEDNDSRIDFWRAIKKLSVFENDHDHSYYGNRAEFLVEYLVNHDYKPRSVGNPEQFWKEPPPFGGGYLIKDETLLRNRRRFRFLE